MRERLKYLSIPCIDNIDLPHHLIVQCRETYNRYGKYKLYDLINAELNNRSNYSLEQLQDFRNIEVARRYLYLYRVAMAQTYSFVYNVDEYELIPKKAIYTDDNKCPYCGAPLNLVPQMGTKQGLPKSHYDDIVKKFTKYILFSKIPVYTTLDVRVCDYLEAQDLGEYTGYTFSYWAFTDSLENSKDIIVNKDDYSATISKKIYERLDETAQEKYLPLYETSLLKHINENSVLSVYAVYTKDSDRKNKMSINWNFVITIGDIFKLNSNVFVKDRFGDDTDIYRPMFNFLEKHNKLYVFDHFSLPDNLTDPVNSSDKVIDDTIYPEPDLIKKNERVYPYLNKDKTLNAQIIYEAKRKEDIELKEDEDVVYSSFDRTLGELILEQIPEPLVEDIVYDNLKGERTDYNLGKYKLKHWSLHELGHIPIIESQDKWDENSIYSYGDTCIKFSEEIIEDIIVTPENCRDYIGKYRIIEKELILISETYLEIFGFFKANSKVRELWTIKIKDVEPTYYKCISDIEVGHDPAEHAEFWKEYTPIRNTHLRDIESIKEESKITLYGYFYYDLEDGGKYAYDDDCYESRFGKYKGITKAYTKEEVKEYQNLNNPEDILSQEQYVFLEEEDKPRYKEIKSFVQYVGYLQVINGKQSYLKDDVVKIVQCERIEDIKFMFKPYDDFRTILNDTTPGTFQIYKRCKEDEMTEAQIRMAYYIDKRGNVINTGKYKFVIKGINGFIKYNGDFNLDKEISLVEYAKLPNDSIATREMNNHGEYDYEGYGRLDYGFFLTETTISLSDYFNLSDYDKRHNCEIYRIYPTYVWNKYQELNDDGLPIIKEIDGILEIVNIKSIRDFFKTSGIKDGTYAIEKDNHADTQKLTYRVYQYSAANDDFLRESVGDDYDAMINPDNEIGDWINKHPEVGSVRNTWVFIPDKDTISELGEWLSGKNPKLTVYPDDVSKVRSNYNNKTLPRMYLSDAKAVNKYSCRVTNVYKIVYFFNDTYLLYCPSRYNGPRYRFTDTYTPSKKYPEYKRRIGITFAELALKYNTSVAVDFGIGIKKNSKKEDYYNLNYGLHVRGPNITMSTFYTGNIETVEMDKDVPVRYSEDVKLTEKEIGFTDDPGFIIYEYASNSEFMEKLLKGTRKVLTVIGGYWKGLKFVKSADIDEDGNMLYYPTTGKETNIFQYNPADPNETLIAKTHHNEEVSVEEVDNGDSDDSATEVDDKTWKDLYGHVLHGEEKNDYIAKGGVNYSGWGWRGWTNPWAKPGDDDYHILSYKGLVESFPFDYPEDYRTLGYPRIIFPEVYNKSYYTENGELVLDKVTDEPIALLRYCSNFACYCFRKYHDKSKWSFRNREDVLRLSESYYTNYKGKIATNAIYEFSLDDHKPASGYLRTENLTKILSTSNPWDTSLKKGSDIVNLRSENIADKIDKSPKRDKPFQLGNIGLQKYVNEDAKEGRIDLAAVLYGYPTEEYWNYPETAGNSNTQYLLHRGGSGEVENKRFEFEYKYATDEYSALKKSAFELSGEEEHKKHLQVDLKQVHGSEIVPMRDRPIEEYQNRYKKVIFDSFRRAYSDAAGHNPYVTFKTEDINVILRIIKELFGWQDKYRDESPSDNEYTKLKLKVFKFMYEWNEFEFVSKKYWDKPNMFYDFNIEYVKSKMENNIAELSDVNAKAAIRKILDKNYTYEITNDTYEPFIGYEAYKIVIERPYTAKRDTSYSDLINALMVEEDPKLAGFVNLGWSKDKYGELIINTKNKLEMNLRAVKAKQTITLYQVFTAVNDNGKPIALTDKILSTVSKNHLAYIKCDLEDDLGLIWFNGPDGVIEEFGNKLSDFHELFMLPVSFMCYLFIFLAYERDFAIVGDEHGGVKTYFKSSGDEYELMKKEGNPGFKYVGALITKPWSLEYDGQTGCAVRNQYYIEYAENFNTCQIYSFLDEGWIDELYGGPSLVSTKFSPYTFIPIKETNSKFITVFPVSTSKYESLLVFVYDTGMGFFDVVKNKWITKASSIIRNFKIFGNNNKIADARHDPYDSANRIIFISNKDDIAFMNLEDALDDKLDESIINAYTNGTVLNNPSIEGEVLSGKGNSATVTTSEEEKNIIKLDDRTSAFDDHSGIVKLITTLKPVENINEDPWILNNGEIPTENLPATCGDVKYKTLNDYYKEKYHLNPKFSVNYAWAVQDIDNFDIDKEIQETFKTRIYTQGFIIDKDDPGEYEIYRHGKAMSRETYNMYPDDAKITFEIYKIEKVVYTFRYFSFSNLGFGIYDEEMTSRLSHEKELFALYYEKGKEVDDLFGYKRIAETHTQEFRDYYNQTALTEKSYSSHIKGWKTPNIKSEFGDKDNKDANLVILKNLKKIYPIAGYLYNGKYTPYFVVSNGYACQVVSYNNALVNPITIVSQIDYEDGNELIDVISQSGSLKVYLLYKNGRIVELETYDYYPIVYTEKTSKMKDVSFACKYIDIDLSESNISYCDTDDNLINTKTRFNSSIRGSGAILLNLKKYAKDKPVSLLDCSISQLNIRKFDGGFKSYSLSEAGDRSKTELGKIN